MKPVNIFISYGQSDSLGSTERIYDALKNNFTVFFEKKEDPFSKHHHLSVKTKNNIHQSGLVLAVFGKESCNEWDGKSNSVFTELSYAKKCHKKILPVFIDNTFSLPKTLQKESGFLLDSNPLVIDHEKFSHDLSELKKYILDDLFSLERTSLESSHQHSLYKIESLLKKSQWEEANSETINLFLHLSNRMNKGWLRGKDIESISCSILLSVNNLWGQYSNGNFGFNTQINILERNSFSLKNPRDFIKLSGFLGWKSKNKWLFKGSPMKIGSFPTPLTFKKDLPTNRNSFFNVLHKVISCRE